MTIHFFPNGDINNPTARYRGFLVAKELEKRGYKVIVYNPPIWRFAFKIDLERLKEFFKHIKIFSSIKKEDIIYLVRTVHQIDFFVLALVFKLFFRKRFIFDFDAALFLRMPGIVRKSKTIKTKFLTKFADAVVVGSHYSADWARKHNKNVYIIPTSIPLHLYEKHSCFERKPNKKFTIGWIGNAFDHYENLKILNPVFEELIRKNLPFKFILVGSLGLEKIYSLFGTIKGLDIEFIDWVESGAIPKIIQNFDIGLMPLLNTEWDQGRCAFKAIEYMACKVPVICSPVGESNYLIEDGINGFLAGGKDEWVSKIEKLYKNEQLRIEMGNRARETILKKYSYEAIVPKLIKIFKNL